MFVVLQDHVGCLSPSRFNYIPHLLDRVQFATLGRQKHLNKLFIEELSNYLGFVYAQVVHDDHTLMSLAFFFKFYDEWKERVSIVRLCESIGME